MIPLCLLVSSADITFANSLDPDQAGQNVLPDLDPNCLTLIIFLNLERIFQKKVLKKSADTEKA